MLLLDLHEVTLPHTTLLAQAVMEAVSKSKSDMPMGWKHVARHLSPSEKEKMRKDTAQRMLDIFRSLPSERSSRRPPAPGRPRRVGMPLRPGP